MADCYSLWLPGEDSFQLFQSTQRTGLTSFRHGARQKPQKHPLFARCLAKLSPFLSTSQGPCWDVTCVGDSPLVEMEFTPLASKALKSPHPYDSSYEGNVQATAEWAQSICMPVLCIQRALYCKLTTLN